MIFPLVYYCTRKNSQTIMKTFLKTVEGCRGTSAKTTQKHGVGMAVCRHCRQDIQSLPISTSFLLHNAVPHILIA